MSATEGQDQFTKVPDPADAKNRRAGGGSVTVDGRTYTRAEWVEECARRGYVLAAGEGAVLVQQLDELRATLAALRQEVT